MKVVIIGGGKVGYYILKTLKESKYGITLIERNEKICEKIAEDFDAEIICGDGTDIEVLKDAGIEDAEVVAAVTGFDEENFVICQIAKSIFNVSKTIARINNPKNRDIFKALGVDKTVCSTEVIANLIEAQFTSDRLKIIQTIDRGEIVLAEATIKRESLCCNKTISTLSLPEECVIVSILREDKPIFPRGALAIKEGDKLLVMTNIERRKLVERCLLGDK